MSNTLQNARTRPRRSPPWTADVVAVVAAVICALVHWTFTALLMDLELTVRRGGEVQRIGGAAVALAAAVSALAGLLVLRLLERVTSRALRIWTLLAAAATLLSLVGPLAATSAAVAGALLSLHAVVAAVVIASAQASRRRHHTVG